MQIVRELLKRIKAVFHGLFLLDMIKCVYLLTRDWRMRSVTGGTEYGTGKT